MNTDRDKTIKNLLSTLSKNAVNNMVTIYNVDLFVKSWLSELAYDSANYYLEKRLKDKDLSEASFKDFFLYFTGQDAYTWQTDLFDKIESNIIKNKFNVVHVKAEERNVGLTTFFQVYFYYKYMKSTDIKGACMFPNYILRKSFLKSYRDVHQANLSKEFSVLINGKELETLTQVPTSFIGKRFTHLLLDNFNDIKNYSDVINTAVLCIEKGGVLFLVGNSNNTCLTPTFEYIVKHDSLNRSLTDLEKAELSTETYN